MKLSLTAARAHEALGMHLMPCVWGVWGGGGCLYVQRLTALKLLKQLSVLAPTAVGLVTREGRTRSS